MSALDLSTALSIALQTQREGHGAVIVTIVTAPPEGGIVLGQRTVVRDDGTSEGRIDTRLDPLLVEDATQSLAERRSRMHSYRVLESIVERAPLQGGNLDVFFEVLARAPHLIIVGAGHIAMPLAHLGKLLDFEVTVVDDRAEYANRERFPDVDTILVGPYGHTVAGIGITADTYIVLVTRGHVHDQACLELVLNSPAAYIGMIGSKKRVRTVLEHARQGGYDADKLQRVHAPIGLDIAAQTPVEISIAIAGEIISVQRGGKAATMMRGAPGRD